MTTSFIVSTVSPDLVITTPEQLLQAYLDIYTEKAVNSPEWHAAWAVTRLLATLKELNSKGS
jgi:hypothetical protein